MQVYPYGHYTVKWTQINVVNSKGEDDIYDLEVYEYHNYLAHGLWHHNSELHSVYDMVHPGELGPQKTFGAEWKRLAQGQQDFFGSESMRGMRDRLSSGMLTQQKNDLEGDDGEALELSQHSHIVPATPEQKSAIAHSNDMYQKDRKSEDPAVRKSAAITRYGRVMRILNNGVKGKDGVVVNPKAEAVARLMDEQKAQNKDGRAVIYSDELEPLRAAGAACKGRKLHKVDGTISEDATRSAVNSINTKGNGTDGVLVSKAGNFGLNFTGANHVFCMHILPTPARKKQVDGRVFRIGQKQNCHSTTIMTDHPMEKLAQYRTDKMKMPEMALLASLADPKASMLAPHLAAIKAAAAG